MNPRVFLVRLAVLWVIGACIGVAVPHRGAAQVESPMGCHLRFASWGGLGELTSSSGNRQLDRAMIAEIRKVDGVFGINPTYSYFRDAPHPNAYATSETQIAVPGARGTIAFGLTLVEHQLQWEYGGAALAGIAAHEGVHIFQFLRLDADLYRRLRSGPTAREQELHADFLAGYYFSVTGRTERSLVVFAESLEAIGDTDFTNPNHHGTGEERVAAMLEGYRHGDMGLNEAATRGIRYVLGM